MSKLLKTSVFLVMGLILLCLGYEKKQTVTNYQMNDTTVTVIDLSKKNSDVNILIILGILLIVVASFIALSKFIPKPRTNPKNRLTNQEKNIVTLIEQGKTNKEIAIELSVSVSTVKTHINNIYKKMDINSREELLQFS